MQDILTCAMGLDVHRDIIVARLAKGELGADPEIEIRSFSTLVPEMKKLRDWVPWKARGSTGSQFMKCWNHASMGRSIFWWSMPDT